MTMRLLALALLFMIACGRSEPRLGRSSSTRKTNVAKDAGEVGDTGVPDTGIRDAGCRLPEVSFYTDRAQWLARIGSPMLAREDFESERFGDLALPYSTSRRLVLRESGSPVIVRVRPPNFYFDSRHLHARDFGAFLEIELPVETTAFGFQYFTSDDGWLLDVADGRMNLPSEMTRVFAGIVVECGRYDTFRLRGPVGPQSGISFDDVEWR